MTTRRHRGVSIAFGVGLLIPLLFWAFVSRVGGQGRENVTPTPTPTTVPFLHPPFAGQYPITSYFDHHTPNRAWDDTVVIFNGDQASAIDGILGRTATFRGGYWFPDTTWYIYYDGHNGIDYGVPKGETILAAAPGEVIFAGSIPSSCDTPLQYVSLAHENGSGVVYLGVYGVSRWRGRSCCERSYCERTSKHAAVVLYLVPVWRVRAQAGYRDIVYVIGVASASSNVSDLGPWTCRPNCRVVHPASCEGR